MAHSPELADRVREALALHEGVTERRMFGALAFMLHGNMACAVGADDLLVRVAPDEIERVMLEPHVGPMEMGGRTMGGFVRVEQAGFETDAELHRWVEVGVEQALARPPKRGATDRR